MQGVGWGCGVGESCERSGEQSGESKGREEEEEELAAVSDLEGSDEEEDFRALESIYRKLYY